MKQFHYLWSSVDLSLMDSTKNNHFLLKGNTMPGLDEDPFEYRATKGGTVIISRGGKRVKTLGSRDSQKFLNRIQEWSEDRIQVEMARVTGNYKRGNEKKAQRGYRS